MAPSLVPKPTDEGEINRFSFCEMVCKLMGDEQSQPLGKTVLDTQNRGA